MRTHKKIARPAEKLIHRYKLFPDKVEEAFMVVKVDSLEACGITKRYANAFYRERVCEEAAEGPVASGPYYDHLVSCGSS